MNDTQLAAAEAMRRQLSNVLCVCVFENPYAPRGKLLKQCGPCKAIAQWTEARFPFAKAGFDCNGKGGQAEADAAGPRVVAP